MIRSPIRKVLSTFRRRRVRALLMGGQACILYGAAEFSRDVDFAVSASPRDLDRLRRALGELNAEPVYFPALSREALLRGHACHFRCRAREVRGLRIDVMTVMRGADPFPKLWKRAKVANLPAVGRVALMGLPDLARVKRTQRDKDWPMIRRLIEADIAGARGHPAASRVSFWLSECRTPELLADLAQRFPALSRRVARSRPAVRAALRGDACAVERELRREEDRERAADRRYWAPLRRELERMRLERPRAPR